jgi:hypothetical protein
MKLKARGHAAWEIQQARVGVAEVADAADPVRSHRGAEDDDQDGQHGSVDQDAADHGEVLVARSPTDLTADLRRALRVADDKEDPRQHEERVREAETARQCVTVLHGGRYHLVVGQALVRGGEAVPAGADAAAVESEQ